MGEQETVSIKERLTKEIHQTINIFPQIGELSLSSYISPSIGIALIIISVICRYGAEVRGEREDEALTNAGNELALGEE